MSDSGRPRPREGWESDHERARQRTAERLSLPLAAAENSWLDHHLRTCASCASVAADYAAQQAALHGLNEPHPPRDLWARTAAALDRAERRAGRSLPNPSVFPGRGGSPGSRGARSIRGLRAEQRASAFRAGPRPIPPRLLVGRPRPGGRPAGFGWLAPFGGLAAMAILIVVGGNALLSGSAITPLRSPVAAPGTQAAGSLTPLATPIQVGAGEVAWLTPADDGTYSLNFVSVDRVCPANAKPDCAPIAGSSPRHLPTVGSNLHTVIRSPSHRQLVVVPASTKKRSGGSVMVVSVPTPVPSSSPAPVVATIPSAPASSAETATPAPSTDGGTPHPSTGASPADSSSAGTSVPPASAVDSSVPASTAPAAATASAPAASSPEGSTPAGTPSPSEPTSPAPSETTLVPASASIVPSGPEPTASALAIINDVVVVGETASYSPDGTMLAFSARPANGTQGPDIYLWRIGDPAAYPITTDHASVFSGWLSGQLLGSRIVDAAGRPASSGVPTQPEPSASTSGDPFATPVETASQGSPSASAGPSELASPGRSTSDPAASVAASSSAAAESSLSVQSVADQSLGALARSFMLDPATGDETDLTAPAWRPVVDPTGRFVVYWAGSLRYDEATLTWIPDRGALVLASWPALRGFDPSVTLAPVPLLDNGGSSIPAGEWDIRWDESGTHLAIWAADAGNPELGRLTLLTIDASGRVDAAGISLHDVPALAGFSIGTDRLAWATPPGQDGEGSRLQILAWSGENAGKIDSQPASGGDAVVVVR